VASGSVRRTSSAFVGKCESVADSSAVRFSTRENDEEKEEVTEMLKKITAVPSRNVATATIYRGPEAAPNTKELTVSPHLVGVRLTFNENVREDRLHVKRRRKEADICSPRYLT
jgi:hypothetical protein